MIPRLRRKYQIIDHGFLKSLKRFFVFLNNAQQIGMSNQSNIPHSIFEKALFLDTGAFKAIYDKKDQYHKTAISFRDQLKVSNYPLYTTNLTIAEAYRLLLYESHLGCVIALNFLDDIYTTSINIIKLNSADEQKAGIMLHKYNDEDLTYTDAINMAVMIRTGLSKVFAFDWHFNLLGFQIYPQEKW